MKEGGRFPLAVVLVSLVAMIGIISLNRNPISLLSKFYSSGTQWREYTLREAAAYVAKNNTVIVCAVGEAYLQILSNWLISLARLNHVEKVVVFAEDYPTLYTVNARWPGHAVMASPPLESAANNFGSMGFYNLTSRRPTHLLEILELGYNVLYNDVDTVWMKDPFPYFEGSHDAYYAYDGEDNCSCLIYLRPTPGAKLLMRSWADHMRSQPWSPGVNDQPPFNWAISQTRGKVDDYLLPKAAFPSGAVYFGNKSWANETKGQNAIVHNNYIVGRDNKIRRFKDHGLWLVDEHSDESPLGRLCPENHNHSLRCF